MAKKKQSMRGPLIFICALAVVLLGVSVFFYVKYNQDIYVPKTVNVWQYTGVPSRGSVESWWHSPEKIASGTATFNLGDNQLKFVASHPGGGDPICGTQPDGLLNRGCCEQVDIYRNDVKIDTIKTGLNANRAGENTDRVKSYFFDSSCTNETACSRIQISALTSNWFYANSCTSMQNGYTIYTAADAFSIDVEPLENQYNLNDSISLKMTIHNNLAPTKAKINIKYTTETVLGDFVKDVSEEIDLSNDTTEFIRSVPAGKDSVLKIKPYVTFFVPTSSMDGVNSDFGTGTVKSIKAESHLEIGNYEFDEISLTISEENNIIIIENSTTTETVNVTEVVNNTVELTCKDFGCPVTYTCSEDNVCVSNVQAYERSSFWLWASIILLIVFVILIAIYVAIKSKRK